ncbi:hypothetical protein AMTR_s00053p00155220 [Amborella trichopoda]|uniref:Peptide chain release factor domain-containing protein n=1 Tax=Amborella trichopoda TaxID=13333 RepID=W1PBW6_AMBTC|nr:hypothetical protein AMTR_s00053p00155220 [Amborella trichopoda]
MSVEAVSAGGLFVHRLRFRSFNGRQQSKASFLCPCVVRAAHSTEDEDRFDKQLGLFSLRKNVEDVAMRIEMMAPMALELEHQRRSLQEEMIRDYNLWDDPAKANEIYNALADTAHSINLLKDLQYKAEEAKLITQLAEMDTISYSLCKQAYNTSIDVSKSLDRYEISKQLTGPYDKEGACLSIIAGSEGVDDEIWAEKLLNMYITWAEKQGCSKRVVEKYPCKDGGECCFDLLFRTIITKRTRGYIRMFKYLLFRSSVAQVDVIPLFMETAPNLEIDFDDLEISTFFPSNTKQQTVNKAGATIRICHIPTGVKVQSSGERNHLANKIKALNRLKAKLLVVAMERGISNMQYFSKNDIYNMEQQETRRYLSGPYKLVHDLKTGTRVPDLFSVLDGNIDTFIGAHISLGRKTIKN